MTFHDLTPLRRVEEMRADFVANASHELRTPLAALSGFIDTLQGPAREDARARERFLGIMHTQATRMARLIDDLLSLSRVELSAHVRPEASIDIVPIIREVADGLEMLASERQVEIEVDRRRVGYIETLLRQTGFPDEVARGRAQVFYWAFIGYALSEQALPKARQQAALDELLRMAKR